MPRVAMIGAGSTVFATRLITDMLTHPELADSTLVSLVDIDPDRLANTEAYARRAVEQVGAGMRIEVPATRREALAGADYVIVMVMIGGVAPFEVDIEVPARFGVDQTVGDTLGPGGVFRGLRTIPFLIDLCTEMEELCPDALLINYANPMAMNCWAMSAATGIRNVGLCHSVQNTSRQLARYCGIPADEVTYWVAGINHMAWFLEFEHDGRDAYPLLREAAGDPAIVAQDPIRLRHSPALRLLRDRVQPSHVGVRSLLPEERRCDRRVHPGEVELSQLLAGGARGFPGDDPAEAIRDGHRWRSRAVPSTAFRSFTPWKPTHRFG